jgi:hypothetical protein
MGKKRNKKQAEPTPALTDEDCLNLYEAVIEDAEKKCVGGAHGKKSRELGWFLSDAPAGRLTPRPAQRTPEEEARIWDAAAEKAFSRKRRKLLEEQITALKSEVAAQNHSLKTEITAMKSEVAQQDEIDKLKRFVSAKQQSTTPVRRPPLWHWLREAKIKYPEKASDQKFLISVVDARLEKLGKRLVSICPPPWRKVRNLPSSLAEARRRPELENAIDVYITKVKVS